MPSSLRPGTGQLSQIRVALALLAACLSLTLAGLVSPQSAHAICGGAAVLTGGCFEGGDGNLSADGGLLFADNTDWATVGEDLLFSDPTAPGTQFVNSSDEQDPTSWSLTTGEPSTNKLDITAGAARIERVGSDIWLDLGFTMKGAAGSANVLVELNSAPVPAGTNPLPVRTAGDALIQFTGNASQAARIGLCKWVGNQFGQGSGGSGTYGWYTTPLPGALITSSNKDCTQVSGGGNPTAIGRVNQGVVLNNLKDETQLVSLTGPSGGTFTLTFNGQTTVPVARNASATTVQTALVALSNIAAGDVSVTAPANGGPFTIRFQGAFAAANVAQMTAAGAGGVTASVSTLGQGGATNYLAAPPFPSPTIAADIFGELSINLTAALGAGGGNPCFNFGTVWLHTYNGNSISSIMADYVVPQSLIGAASCAVSVDKKVAVNQDAVNAPANAGDYHEGTPADPSTAQVGDYLWYRLAVTNSGTVALTPNVTDANCDLPVGATPIEKKNAANVSDPTPGTFDSGDVWTYLCKHQLAAGDPEPYVNTVKATGTNGTFTTPEVQDTASTTSNGSLVVKKDFTGPFDAAHRVNLLVGGVVKAASVGDDGMTPSQPVGGGASVSFGEGFTVGSAPEYTSSAACVDTKGTAGTGDDTPVSSTFDAGTLSGDVTVAGRKAILCTITNARRTGSIQVVKDLDPGSDGGRFNLSVDGVGRDVASGPGMGGADFGDLSQSAAITVATGASHTVAEVGSASPATSLSDYVSSVSCTKNGGAYIASTLATSLGSISVAAGDAVLCSFVNTRKGSLTVKKDFTGPFESTHRVNISAAGSQRNVASGGANDGTADFGDGDDTGAITVDGGSTVAFSEAFVAPATAAQYTASAQCVDTKGTADGSDDTSVASSFSAGSLAGSVGVAAGTHIRCTITNDRRTGRIKVVKQIVPVAGQLGDPGLFDLQVDGSTERADAAAGDATAFVTKPTGSHTVGELAGASTSLADYDASVACADDSAAAVDTTGAATPWSLTLAPGVDVTCTITNTRKKGSVKLVKDIVPVDAAVGDQGLFDLHIDGEGAYDATKDEARDGDFVELTVPNGPVALSETADDETSLGDYLTAFACENTAPGNGDDPVIGAGTSITGLDVSDGDSWVCTLTNTRKRGTVALVKDIVPVDAQLGDPGKFDLGIDAGNGYFAGRDEAGDDELVSLVVPTGAVDLFESADDETDLANYDTTYNCTNLTPDNTDAPVSGSGASIDDLAVTAGDEWRCVLRNARKQGGVQLTKVIVAVDTVLGDPGRFDLAIDGEGAYDTTKSDAVNGDSIAINVPNGTVDLSETGGTATNLTNYDSSYRCENVAPGNTDAPVIGTGTTITGVVVTEGDQWQCTFTNTRKRGDVKIVKDIVPVDGLLGDPGRFDLLIDGEGAYDASRDEAGDGDSVQRTVPNGPVDVSETADGETSLSDYVSSYSCVNGAEGNTDAPVTGAGTSISGLDVTSGDDWTCTFTNTRKQGSVKLVKDVVPVDEQLGDPGKFDLLIDGEGSYDAARDEAGDGDSVQLTVPNGPVDLSESADGETSLSDYVTTYSCLSVGDDPVSGQGTSIDNLPVTAGDAWVCTFTNARKSGSVRLVKDVVPVDEQLGDPGRFDLLIDGEGSYDAARDEAGDGDSVQLTVPNGLVDLSETADVETSLSDYATTYSCLSVGDEPVSGQGTSIADLPVSAGDDWTCTFRNERKQASVKLVKDVVPVDEQLGDPGKFDLTIDGENGYDAGKDEAGDGDFVEISLPNGTVDLSETADGETSLTDYVTTYSCANTAEGNQDDPVSGDGAVISGLVVTSGDRWQCILRNERKKGHVKLVKDIVPVDEQLGDPGKFNLTIDGESGYDATTPDAVDGGLVELTVPNGPVDLSETAGTDTILGDYTTTYSCVNEGDGPVTGGGTSIADLPVEHGDNWTCTLRNERKQGNVQLTKVIVAVDSNLGDPGRFDLLIDAEGSYDQSMDDAANGDSIAIDVPNGLVDLSESAGTATNLGNYLSSYSCVNTAEGNSDAPVSGEGTAITNLDVTPGDIWRCTFTNTRKKGDVKLVKDIVPVNGDLGDPGKFDLLIDGEGAYDATKDEAVDGDSVQLTVPNGPVDLSETADDETSLVDYDSTYRCVNAADENAEPVSGDGTSIADLPVDQGDDWTCTFTNVRKQGVIRLVKDIVPVDEQLGDPGKFDLLIDGEGAYDAIRDEAGDGELVELAVPNGLVDLSESADDETSLGDYVSSYSCQNVRPGNEDPLVTGDGISISDLPVTSGDLWTCTFTNTRKKGSVTLVKDIVPVDEQLGDPGKFDLAIDGEGSYDAAKDEAGDNDSVELTVPNGPVDLSETADDETSLDDYISSHACLNLAEGNEDQPVSGEGPSITDLPVSAGDDWRCVLRNERKKGSVTLVKDIVPVDAQLGDPGKFDLAIDGEGSYDAAKDEAGDNDSVQLTVPNGPVDLSESADVETSLSDYVTTYSCVNEGDDPVSGQGISIADLPVSAGDDWRCVLRNERKKGSVTLVKDIVPVDEQLGDPGKFDLLIDGEGDYDAARDEAGDNDSVQLTVPNGPVDLSEGADDETSLDDYTSTYACLNVAEGGDDQPVSGDGTSINDLPVSAGDDWRCVLRNERKQGTVTIGKVIIAVDQSLGDPGKFDLSIDGEGDYDKTLANAVNGSSTSLIVPGGPVDLSEAAGDETSLADYSSTYECVNSADGAQDAPVTGEGTSIANLVVKTGDVWTCTFTNTRDKGHVKLVKDVVPVDEQLGDPGKFDLAIDGEGDYDATKDEAGDGDSVERDVPNGPVDLSESADDETSLGDYISSFECVNNAVTESEPVSGSGTVISDLPVRAGDDWTCTLRNERKKGKVTAVKHLNPSTDGGLFDLSIDGPLGYDKTASDRSHGGSVTISLPTGSADVAEAAGSGTALGAYISSYRCENVAQGTEDDPISGDGTSVDEIAVTAGDDWVCTFTNVRKPQIVVKKLAEPAGDDVTGFSFTSNLPSTAASEGSQEIGQDGAFSLKHGQQVQTLAAPGRYSVTESDVYALNYKLKSAVCDESVPNNEQFDLASNEQSDSDRTRSFTADPGDVITCTFINEKLVGLQVVAKTPKSQSVYLDQNVSYQYEVTNTGTSDLTDVTVADDRCPGPATRQADGIGDGDSVLEPGEKWVYTCTVAASAIFTGDVTQVTNTVTVNAKDQEGKPVAPSQDTAVTNLLKPGITIDKTGPASATAGDLITYNLAVTNTGNTVFNDGMVILADAQCQAPPALLTKNGDSSPATLSPGETWTYSCQVQTLLGQQKVDNTGSVTGTDQGGRHVTATDVASTALSQPAIQALPNPTQRFTPGTAKLRGTVGCATATYAKATISGRQIKSVTYFVNGKKLSTLTKPTKGNSYTLRVKVRSLEYGAHKVTARVVFVEAARTKTKTLQLQFSRCLPRVVQPKFTG